MPRLNQKLQPCLSKSGSNRNSRSEGRTSQKIWLDRLAICSEGDASMYSHTKASNEVSGRDATKAANPVERLAISEMATIINAEMITLSA